jgi:hypothetical protein
MINMHNDRSDEDIFTVPPYRLDEDLEDERELSPPASTVFNSSFSGGADHGHSDKDAGEYQDSDEDAERQNGMQVQDTGSDGLVQKRFKRAAVCLP